MTRKELRKLHEESQARFALAMIFMANMDRQQLADMLGWSVNKMVRTIERLFPLPKGRKRRDNATGKTVAVETDLTNPRGKI